MQVAHQLEAAGCGVANSVDTRRACSPRIPEAYSHTVTPQPTAAWPDLELDLTCPIEAIYLALGVDMSDETFERAAAGRSMGRSDIADGDAVVPRLTSDGILEITLDRIHAGCTQITDTV